MGINKILISGSNGFFGQHLFNSLKKEYEVVRVDREEINKTHDPQSIKEVDKYRKIDLIIMCHASVASGRYTPSLFELEDVNVRYTEKLLNLFSGVRTIYISSASVFENGELITENSKVNPKSMYSKAKRNAEKLVLNRQGNIVVRLTSLFGQNMKENTIIPSFVNQAIENNHIRIVGNGTRIQNYLSVNEAVNYIKVIINNFEKVTNKVLLLIGPEHVTNENLAKFIALKFDNCQIEKTNSIDSENFVYDNFKSRELLHYQFKFSFLSELNDYINWKIANVK